MVQVGSVDGFFVVAILYMDEGYFWIPSETFDAHVMAEYLRKVSNAAMEIFAPDYVKSLRMMGIHTELFHMSRDLTYETAYSLYSSLAHGPIHEEGGSSVFRLERGTYA